VSWPAGLVGQGLSLTHPSYPTNRSCLIYAFAASVERMSPASMAGLTHGLTGYFGFMRQLLAFGKLSLCAYQLSEAAGWNAGTPHAMRKKTKTYLRG
jgi:hypothetical protein